MKKSLNIAIAILTAVVTLQTVAHAEDPISPTPGAKVSVFSTQENLTPEERWQTLTFGTLVPLTVSIDTKGSFSIGKVDENKLNYDADTLIWEGFLLSKAAGQFAFTVVHSAGTSVSLKYRNGKSVWFKPANQFAIQINGETFFGNGNKSFVAHLSAGYNKVKIMATMWTGSTPTFTLSYKPANSTIEPRAITPAMLFHEDEYTNEDW